MWNMMEITNVLCKVTVAGHDGHATTLGGSSRKMGSLRPA